MNTPVATYRLQLRDGVDFDAAARFLPHLGDLGISHLYLSPLFTARAGSSHGYDVIDPGAIDPVLGGREGLARLATAARAAGIGLVIDIVPNHMAFSLENPWLADVLRHGRDSRFARHFDIEWDAGPLMLPWLDAPFEALVAEGAVARDGETLTVGDLAVPLRPDSAGTDPADLHAAQHWRLVHWARERDGITHRRFFNVTDLIGVRVEEAAVFDDMHRLTVELVQQGLVQGLRVDHVDGLADPAAYLAQLRAAVGATPVWVEKILTGDEALPDWPVEGTTGYEAATKIAQVLGEAAGAEALRSAWVADTGGAPHFHDALAEAKAQVLRRDLPAELQRLVTLADRAAAADIAIDPGAQALREAFAALLEAFPRYRTYFTPQGGRDADRALMAQVADAAAATLRSRDVLDRVAAMITDPADATARAVQRRFQQVTGALLAKSHEDTAGFRWTPYLAACEVGADPDVPTIPAAGFASWCATQPPQGLILTSSHDAKRSEDARMRLVACSHRPDALHALIARADALPGAAAVPRNLMWYLVQSALALWSDAPDLGERLRDHATKAMREADEITSWPSPVAEAEEAVQAFVASLVADWRADLPGAVADLAALGARLSLAQLALKLAMPGVPDIYRGCEGAFLALTDPDNRLPVDLETLRGHATDTGLSGQKWRLTRDMLALRARAPDLFGAGTVGMAGRPGDALILTRRHGDACLSLTLRTGAPLAEVVTVTTDGLPQG